MIEKLTHEDMSTEFRKDYEVRWNVMQKINEIIDVINKLESKEYIKNMFHDIEIRSSLCTCIYNSTVPCPIHTIYQCTCNLRGSVCCPLHPNYMH